MDQTKKIVIRLPMFRTIFNVRNGLILLLLFGIAYWYLQVRPFLNIQGARLEAFTVGINADAAGRIAKMWANEGEFVKQGQALFKLEDDLLLAKKARVEKALNELTKQVEVQKEQVGKAMQAYLDNANEELVEKYLLQMEEAQEKSELALSKIDSMKAELNFLDLQLNKLSFLAPFDGTVIKRDKNPGAVVNFGDPLYFFSDLKNLWVNAEIPEKKIGQVSIGMPARIRFLAYPDREFIGKVISIGPATVQPEMVPIKISFETQSFPLMPGLTANVSLKIR